MLDAQPSGNDREPGREAGAAVRVEGPQTPEILLFECIEHAGVPIHCGVVATAQGTAHVEQQGDTDVRSRSHA